MSKHKSVHTRRPLARRFLRISPVAAAVGVLLWGALSAHAQPVAQTVVVTGIRGSIESSIAAKRDADGVVEVITAEDIGKLPDVSIAEALARLPGLAGQRVNGRVQEIALRGLSGDFAGVLLNGREQVSTGDNRGVEYDQFPSEFVNRATVYKTADAGLVGQGISGTVGLTTVKPLDYRSRQINLSARAERNSNGAQMPGISANGNRFSVSYVDQFADNTIGVALGFAHLDSPLQAQRYNAFGWSVSQGNQDYIRLGGITAPSSELVAIITGFEVGPQSATQRRDGAIAVIEFKPTKNLHSTLDVYYSQFKTRSKDILFQMLGIGRFNGVMSNLTQEDSIVNSGLYSTSTRLPQFNGGSTTPNTDDPRVRYQVNRRDDDLKAIGWNTVYKLDDWKLGADLSHSVAKRKDVRIETYNSINLSDTLRFKLPASGDAFPTFTTGRPYDDPNTLKLTEQFGRLGYSQRPEIKDKLSSLRVDVSRRLDLSILSQVDLGLNVSQRDKSRDWNEDYFRAATPATRTVIGSEFLTAPVSIGYAGLPSVLNFDIEAALGKYATLSPNFIDGNTFGRRWAVHETISTGFAKLGLDATLLGVPIRGNVGLQFVRSEQDSDGFDQQNRPGGALPVAQPVNRGASYDNVLPSLNLTGELGPSTFLRFGAGRAIARPRMDEMRAFNSASLSTGTDQATGLPFVRWSGSGGNPALKPWKSDNFDLSLEHYFGKGSYVSLAGFMKDLKTYIYNQTTTIDYTGYPNQTNLVPTTNFGTFSRPENGEGGKVTGTEFAISLQGSLLSSWLDGFGIVASLSDTHSDLRPNGPSSPTKLAGLSGSASNFTAYYEKAGFSARISQRKRSPFRAEVTGLFGFRSFVTSQSDAVSDLQVGYQFEGGAMKGLGLLFQVNNLSNAAYRTYNTVNGINQPAEYNRYGRQYLMGLSYKL